MVEKLVLCAAYNIQLFVGASRVVFRFCQSRCNTILHMAHKGIHIPSELAVLFLHTVGEAVDPP